MFQAWVYRLRLITAGVEIGGIDDLHNSSRRRDASSCLIGVDRILGDAEIALLGNRRRSRNNVLVRRETWSLIGLKHAIAESIGFRQREVRLHIRRLHILKPWIRRGAVGIFGWTADCNLVRTIHGAIVPFRQECAMAVTKVVFRYQRDWCQLNGLST